MHIKSFSHKTRHAAPAPRRPGLAKVSGPLKRLPGVLLVMGSHFRALFLAVLFLTTLSMPALLWPQTANAEVLISHKSVQVKALPQSTLRAIFNMRLTLWPDQTPITVFVLPNNHPVHLLFTKQLLGMFPYQLQRTWDRLVFSGTGMAPISVSSEEEMLRQVASTPGAIGYLHGNTANSGIKRTTTEIGNNIYSQQGGTGVKIIALQQ